MDIRRIRSSVPRGRDDHKGLMAMRSTGRRRSLRILSPDFIGKATDETATQVTRIGLTFLGTSAFCLLSLLSPDSALLGGSERISVPFAGPVSFFGFMLLGPAVLIVLRIYLQIYVEHSERLERLARSMSIARAPMLVPLQNPLIRYFSGLIFYLLLPLTMLLFAWKAAVFPAWGSGLLGVAEAVVASHLMLPLKKFSWPSKALLSTGAAIVVAAMIVAPQIQSHLQHAPLKGAGLVRRPFALNRVNLSGHWLVEEDLSRAYLSGADLSGANLSGADLSGARLSRAYVSPAANLSGADLRAYVSRGADLSYDANLSGADLSGADLSGANLSAVRDLTQEQLDQACGNADTKPPGGLTLKTMCKR
jgi:Pentapeptide repeats (8 copies)